MSVPLEVAVVGGGPAGLSAALAAARAGARVVLFDAYARPGGQYYRQPPERLTGQMTAKQQAGRALWEQVRAAGVEIHSDALVWDATADRRLFVSEQGGAQIYTAAAVILAAGAYERPVAFSGWTLPGVITAGAAQTLLYHHVRPGRRALVVGAGPLQLVTAAELLHAGVEIAAVLEGSQLFGKALRHLPALWGQGARLREGLSAYVTLARHGAPYRVGWGIVAAHGTDAVEGATIARLDAGWRPVAGSEQDVRCDVICVGHGLIPFSALASIMGAAMEWRPDLGGATPVRDANMQTSLPGVYVAGDGAGIGGARMALLEGEIAGVAAAATSGHDGAGSAATLQRLAPALAREKAFQQMYAALFTPGPGAYELAREDTLICRCEGVTLGALRGAAEAGAATLAEAKALTRCGMGECQGRMCGQQAAHALARFTGRDVADVGLNRPRPPVMPVSLEVLSQAGAGDGVPSSP